MPRIDEMRPMDQHYTERIEQINLSVDGKFTAFIADGHIEAKLKIVPVCSFNGAWEIPGMLSWVIRSGYVPQLPNAYDRCRVEFDCLGKKMRGECFYLRHTENEVLWRGTGELVGFDKQRAFKLTGR